MKKLASILLSMLLLTSTFVACNNATDGDTSDKSDTSSSTEDKGSDEGEDKGTEEETSGKLSDEPVTISMLYADNAGYPYNADWLTLTTMQEMTNVTLDVQVVADSDFGTQAQVVMNSGQMPDIICKTGAEGGVALDLALNGKLLPFSDYYGDMPKFSEAVDTLGIQAELDNRKLSDGKIYSMPINIEEMRVNGECWFIRKDIFEKNNIPVPATYDDVYEAAKTLKGIYPDVYPIQVQFMQGDLFNMMSPGFGILAGGWCSGPSYFMYMEGSDSWEFVPTTDNYKEMLMYLNKIYTEGLLDLEYNTMDSSVFTQKVTTGEGFITSLFLGQNGGIENDGKEFDPDIDWAPVAPFSSNVSDGYLRPAEQCKMSFISPATVAEKDYFDTYIKWIDWMYDQEGGANLFSWGVEGVTYEVKEDGSKVKILAEGEENNFGPMYGVNNNNLSYIYSEEYKKSDMDPELLEAIDYINANDMYLDIQPNLLLTADDKEIQSLYSTALTDYTNAMTDKFISGDASFDEWDAYVAECNNKGLDKIYEVFNNAWDVQTAG